ncbi:hypothetical protein ASPCADRAFT_208783 [Aspergillus carbonarius ITEM 5010]|uniref:Uncharacterized protein n=1 Tax=Aspergillus carbonarius (strain ITEM 5010) TaxID=602072 RepID=A0A1R3RIG8_ASPC5|nr:hypothetical protein ASPCADRAFT_208783 [Aspergillus carbonarius ITEM 5010]
MQQSQGKEGRNTQASKHKESNEGSTCYLLPYAQTKSLGVERKTKQSKQILSRIRTGFQRKVKGCSSQGRDSFVFLSKIHGLDTCKAEEKKQVDVESKQADLTVTNLAQVCVFCV